MKKKGTSIFCGREVKAKYKVGDLTTFAPCDLPEKRECIEYLENFLAQVMQDPGAMKNKNFETRYNYTTVVK